MFQSPRSGKFESNLIDSYADSKDWNGSFQSPRSGKFESNSMLYDQDLTLLEDVSIP